MVGLTGDTYVRLGDRLPTEPVFSSEYDNRIGVNTAKVVTTSLEVDLLVDPAQFLTDMNGLIYCLCLTPISNVIPYNFSAN